MFNNLTIETKYHSHELLMELSIMEWGLGVEIKKIFLVLFVCLFLEDNNKIKCKYSPCEHSL